MNIRLPSTNTEASRRTLELTKFRPKVSMSGAEKTSNLKQSANQKKHDERVEYFNSKEKQGN